MKIVVKNGTYELENTLKQNGYEIETYDDDVEFFKVVEKEVEKVVEVEKPLPSYLEAINVKINKFVDERIADKTQEYEVYKTKYEKIASLFRNDEEVVEQNATLEKTVSSRKKDVIRFFINMGKKDKIKVYNLTDMIVSRTRLSNADINNVDLHDEFSFFEVPKKYESEIYAAFNRKEKNGRKIIVEESRPKEKKGSGKKRGGVGRKRSNSTKNK